MDFIIKNDCNKIFLEIIIINYKSVLYNKMNNLTYNIILFFVK